MIRFYAASSLKFDVQTNKQGEHAERGMCMKLAEALYPNFVGTAFEGSEGGSRKAYPELCVRKVYNHNEVFSGIGNSIANLSILYFV